jgi:hypothetical protein
MGKKQDELNQALLRDAFRFIGVTAASAGDTISYQEAILLIGGRLTYIARILREKNVK